MLHRYVPSRDEFRSSEKHARMTSAVPLPCLLAIVLWTSPGYAQSDMPLTLAEAEESALDGEPGRESLLARADALNEQAVVAGELPDPQFRVGLANFPVESGGFSTEGMTQAQLGLRQTFPPGDTRAVNTRRFESLAAEMTENADARDRDVLTAVRTAWFDTRYWSDAEAIVEQTRPLFSDLVTVTRSLYAVGRKDQQDVLRAELELSRVDDRLIEAGRQRARARAALSEWVGEAARRPLAASEPSWERLPPLADLREALRVHPAMGAAEARIDARRAEVELANERYKPGWALDLAYGYRDGLLPDGAPRSDFVSLSVTVDLPLFRKHRQDRSLRAALSERRAADASKEQLQRRLKSQLDAEYARWQDLGRRVELYENTILIQADDRARAALAAYQSDAGDFADVMRGSIDVLNTQIEHLRLRLERAQSYAVLANLGGLPR